MNFGQMSAVVWPPYVGVENAEGFEPHDDFNYGRGQITWRTERDGIFGSAQILVPAGIYVTVVFYSGPGLEHQPMGDKQPLEHPVVYNRPGVIEFDPIQCGDYLPRR